MNIIFVGLGLHARHYHYNILEKYQKKYDIRVKLLIDLQDQQEIIEKYLETKSLKPEKVVFIPERYRNCSSIPEDLLTELELLAGTVKIDGIIISTEPKSHKQYILWALKNDIDVLVDKPITAFNMDTRDINSACTILQDYLDIRNASERSNSIISVMAPRRQHKGINLIRDYLLKELEQFGIPITYISIYYSEGMWNMPCEFITRENHPYKYGYGLMLHSGYHFVDLLCWLAELNRTVSEGFPDSIDIYAANTTPYDFVHQIGKKAYKKLFENSSSYDFLDKADLEQFKFFGEVDVNAVIQFMANNAVITTGVLNLLQTGFSRRAWEQLPQDTYKKNGRVRHEIYNIQMGTILNIQAQYCQTGDPAENPNRMEIKIFRNSGLIGGKTYEEIVLDDKNESGISLMAEAREKIILNWLEKSDTQSEFSRHANTELLLSKIYESILRGRNNLNREVGINLNGKFGWN